MRVGTPAIGYAAAFVAATGLLVYRLGSLVPGMSQTEVMERASSSNIGVLRDDPLNLPYKALSWLAQQTPYHGATAMRLVSVLFALATLGLFYYVLKRWYTIRIATLGTLLLATSSWFLHMARLGEPLILQLALTACIAYGIWLQTTKKAGLALIIGAVLVAYLVYIPGLVWFMVFGLLWQFSRLKRLAGEAPASFAVAIILFVVLLIPLAWGLYLHTDLLRPFAGLPVHGPSSFKDVGINVAQIPLQLFWRGPDDPVIGLGRLPFLDIFVAVMALLGGYAYFLRRKLDRSKVIGGSILLGIILIGLGGPVTVALFLPIIYILAAAGIALMLQQWFTVFPRNPFARTIAATLISIAVLMTCFYHLSSYFVAWPNTPVTRQTFSQRP